MFNIGDALTFKGEILSICEVYADFKEGVLKSKYKLSPKNGLSKKPTYNKNLIGLSLDGKVVSVSGELDNLFAQNGVYNRAGGEWYNMERDWANAIRDGSTVTVDMTPNYTGNSQRPDSVTVVYSIDGGVTRRTIPNP